MSQDKKFDVMVVGELNVDLILNKLNKPPQLGKEQIADEMTLTLGSSTAIYAANSNSLGLDVAFCGKVGTDQFGTLVMNALADKGVNTDYVITDDQLKTGATVIFRYDNDRMMVTHPGAMNHMTVPEVPDELFEKSGHIHTSAIFLQPRIKKDLLPLFRKAKAFGLTTSMDTQWDPQEEWDLDFEHLLPLLDFFLPNDQELLQLTGASDVDGALEQLSGYDTCIVVKCGERGAVMQKDGTKHAIPAYDVSDDFVDAVGAGDSFNAGFIHGFVQGKPLKECLAGGNLAAAVSTTAAGGTDGIQSYRQVTERGNTLQLRTGKQG